MVAQWGASRASAWGIPFVRPRCGLQGPHSCISCSMAFCLHARGYISSDRMSVMVSVRPVGSSSTVACAARCRTPYSCQQAYECDAMLTVSGPTQAEGI